ncbi:MAG: hypothetical protein KDB03_21030 [Planctomycetales bacterium]|nr:hypothetical protein [Planctomycetales bacterium]
MSKLSSFFLGIAVGAGGLYTSENYYVVRSNESLHLIPKVAAKLEFPYYDIRQYKVDDWNRNPSLALAIIRSKKQNLMMDSGVNEVKSQMDALWRSLGNTE